MQPRVLALKWTDQAEYSNESRARIDHRLSGQQDQRLHCAAVAVHSWPIQYNGVPSGKT